MWDYDGGCVVLDELVIKIDPDDKDYVVDRRDPDLPPIEEVKGGGRVKIYIFDGGTTQAWLEVKQNAVWRGSWSLDTYYNDSSIIIEGGKLYYCAIGHTSTDDDEPNEGTHWTDKWRFVSDNTQYRDGGWHDKRAYYKGDVIFDDDDTCWLATANHTSEEGYNEPGMWQDADYLSGGDVELKSSKTYTLAHPGCGPYEDEWLGWACTNNFQTNEWLYKIYSNNMIASVDNVEAAWDTEYEYRLLRKPLEFVSSRDDDCRWDMTNVHNVRMRLKKTIDDDPTFDASPDLIEDEEEEGNVKLTEGINGIEAGSIEFRGKMGWFHLQVDEVGARSIVNYVEKVPIETYTVNTAWDWLEPDGIHWCPFDTSDTDNFKVTMEPLYESDEYDRPIISTIGFNKVQLYLMPRMWAYYCRNWQNKITMGGTINCWEVDPEDPENPQSFEVNDLLRRTQFAHHIGIWFDRFPCNFTLETAGETDPQIWIGPVPYVDDSPYPTYETYGAKFYDVFGSLSKEEMKEYFESAGLNPDNVISGVNGPNSLFFITGVAGVGSEPDSEIDTGGTELYYSSGGWVYGEGFTYNHWNRLILWSRANLSDMETDMACQRGLDWWAWTYCNLYAGYCECITPTTDLWYPIWQKIEKSDFWDKYGVEGDELLAGYDNTPDDNICYGIGLVPACEGTLVAVVRSGARDFYVWRKTDEEMSLYHTDDVTIPNHPYGFEPTMEVDFATRTEVGGGICFVFTLYDEDYPLCMSPFNVINGREITGALRPQPPIDSYGKVRFGLETTGQQYTFPQHIFVIGGRERYLKEIPEYDPDTLEYLWGRVWRTDYHYHSTWSEGARNQR